ncbi:MAG: hypothetical protein IKF56_05485 [Eggerthellaceae bacterium]|nr:hypothetical protein [Eggerthellaceae bacterium]
MQFDCGISMSRLAAWLDEELCLDHEGEGWAFRHGDATCHVTLEPLENRLLGSYSIERTMLAAEGDDTALKEFERLFTLRFASAGG